MSTKQQQFHDFCIEQIDRLGGAFPDFRFYKPVAVDELVAWLESKAAGDKQNAMVFITEVTQFENLPRIAELNNLWRQMYPRPEEVRRDCDRCGGSGWIEVQGPFGTSAAYPCHHGPATDSDRRMGVRISPAVARHYGQLEIEASKRRAVWQGSGGKPNAEALKNITAGKF